MYHINCYCTADSYPLREIANAFADLGKISFHQDVLYISPEEIKGDVFLFNYGTVIFWNCSFKEEQMLLKRLKSFENEPFDRYEIDRFNYKLGEKPGIESDQLVLPNELFWTKLAASHGFAQSVKVSMFEISIEKTITLNRPIARHLSNFGKIPLSRREISKKMGRLFMEKSSVNLHTDMMDTPTIFWEHADVEPIYELTCHYLDMKNRVEVLYHRLDVIQQLFDMLSSELNHQHSYILEWIIILLIFVEIVITLVKDVFELI